MTNSSSSAALFVLYVLMAVVLIIGIQGEFEKTREACQCREETMDPKKLAAWVASIAETGPSRVVINAEGEATTPRRAKEEYNIEPSIIYIRDDGWSLGTTSQFDEVAWRMWPDEWAAVMRKDEEGKWHWKDYDVHSRPST